MQENKEYVTVEEMVDEINNWTGLTYKIILQRYRYYIVPIKKIGFRKELITQYGIKNLYYDLKSMLGGHK